MASSRQGTGAPIAELVKYPGVPGDGPTALHRTVNDYTAVSDGGKQNAVLTNKKLQWGAGIAC